MIIPRAVLTNRLYAITITPNEKNNWTWCIPQSETNYNKGITSTAND